jgi:hypothetical protein
VGVGASGCCAAFPKLEDTSLTHASALRPSPRLRLGRHAQTEEQVISPEHECHYLPPLHPCALHRAAQGRVRRRIFILPGQEAPVNLQRLAAANHMRNYLSVLCLLPFHRGCVSIVQTGTRAERRPLPLTIRDSTWLDDSCDIALARWKPFWAAFVHSRRVPSSH